MEAFPAKNVLTGCEVDQLWRPLCIGDRERREKREKGKEGRWKNSEEKRRIGNKCTVVLQV